MTRHQRSLAVLAVLAQALLAGRAAHAADDAVPLCFTDFPPYVSTSLPDGGTLGALAMRAFANAGVPVQIVRAPWARAFTLAKTGGCVLLTLWRDTDRDALFSYSLPVARMQLGLFVRGDRDAAPPAGASVAFQRGSYLPAALNERQYKLNPVVDMHPALQMLTLGRVEAVFSERAAFEYLLEKEARRPTEFRWVSPALEVKTAFMAVAKTHPQAERWLEILNQEIRQSAPASIRN